MISPKSKIKNADINIAIQSGAIWCSIIGNVSTANAFPTNKVDKSKWCYEMTGNNYSA